MLYRISGLLVRPFFTKKNCVRVCVCSEEKGYLIFFFIVVEFLLRYFQLCYRLLIVTQSIISRSCLRRRQRLVVEIRPVPVFFCKLQFLCFLNLFPSVHF